MPPAPSLPIDPAPMFASATRYEIPVSSVRGDMELPVLVGGSAVFLEQTEDHATLYHWQECSGPLAPILDHAGHVRCTLGQDGAAVLVLLEGRPLDEVSLRPLAGRIVLVTADHHVIELARKAAGERCPGGDGLGWKRECADFDADGRVVVELADRFAVHAPDGHLIAERTRPASPSLLVGWKARAVVWEEPAETGVHYRSWDPDTGVERTAKRPTWTHLSVGGARRQCRSAGHGPWSLGPSRRLAWRAADGTEHRYTLPAAYGSWQWFAGEHLLCSAVGQPPLVIDVCTGRGRYCFGPDSELGVLVASPTAMKLLAIDAGRVAVVDASDLA